VSIVGVPINFFRFVLKSKLRNGVFEKIMPKRSHDFLAVFNVIKCSIYSYL